MAVRIQLQGGLGNQLFIWAMAHSVANKKATKVKLIHFTDSKSRIDRPVEIYELAKLCTHNISIKESKFFCIAFKALDKIQNKKFVKEIDLFKIFRVQNMKSSFEIPTEVTASQFIRGYFQDVNVVEENKSCILSELTNYLLTIKVPPPKVRNCREVVLHIRRGDSTDISEQWGILDFKYYSRAVPLIKDLTICTDDNKFAKNLKIEFPKAEVLTPEVCSTWQTLKVMSEAHQLVMANSTLSWWSGWLASQSIGKKVFFPYPWRPENSEITNHLIFEGATLNNSNFGEV